MYHADSMRFSEGWWFIVWVIRRVGIQNPTDVTVGVPIFGRTGRLRSKIGRGRIRSPLPVGSGARVDAQEEPRWRAKGEARGRFLRERARWRGRSWRRCASR